MRAVDGEGGGAHLGVQRGQRLLEGALRVEEGHEPRALRLAPRGAVDGRVGPLSCQLLTEAVQRLDVLAAEQPSDPHRLRALRGRLFDIVQWLLNRSPVSLVLTLQRQHLRSLVVLLDRRQRNVGARRGGAARRRHRATEPSGEDEQRVHAHARLQSLRKSRPLGRAPREERRTETSSGGALLAGLAGEVSADDDVFGFDFA